MKKLEEKCYDNGPCMFFWICIYNQILQHSKIRAVSERCLFYHTCFVKFIHCWECRANGFVG